MIYISPSLLSADMANLELAVRSVESAADYIHCDVMDGHFVPNLTFGAPVVRALKRISKLPLDVHLMIDNPGRWIDDYVKAGLDERDFLVFHVEAEDNPLEIVNYIKERGIKPGISVKPGTDLNAFLDVILEVSQVLVMTVEPGFGGQSFMSKMMTKVELVKSISNSELLIGVDGGIDVKTAPAAVRAGANLLIAGSAIYGKDNPAQAVSDIRSACLRRT